MDLPPNPRVTAIYLPTILSIISDEFQFMGQKVKQKQKKKQKKDTKLEFEVGKVFGPEAAKEDDLSLDVEVGRYKAQKGQGGDRGANDSGHIY